MLARGLETKKNLNLDDITWEIKTRSSGSKKGITYDLGRGHVLSTNWSQSLGEWCEKKT